MKKLFALTALALVVAGCAGSDKNPQPQPQPTGTGKGGSVDECPRADGTPCR